MIKRKSRSRTLPHIVHRSLQLPDVLFFFFVVWEDVGTFSIVKELEYDYDVPVADVVYSVEGTDPTQSPDRFRTRAGEDRIVGGVLASIGDFPFCVIHSFVFENHVGLECARWGKYKPSPL